MRKKGLIAGIILICIIVLGVIFIAFNKDDKTNKNDEQNITNQVELTADKIVEEDEKKEYKKGILTDTIYESEFCGLRFTCPEDWMMMSENEIEKNAKRKMGEYTYELAAVNSTGNVSIALIVEKLPTAEFKLEDYMKTIVHNNTVIKEVISDDKTITIAGEQYAVLECDVGNNSENKNVQMDYYVRKIEDRAVCIMVFYLSEEKADADSVLTGFMKF